MSDPKINILLVDDVPGKLLALESVLDELGQNLVSVTSGREALRRLLNEDFAVILLDVSMPDIDGFETAALIRQRQRTEHTPIIFITAHADDTHAIHGYKLGAVDYIMAPVVPEVLRAKVSVFVELFRMQQQVKRQAEERVALAQEQALRMAAEKANRAKSEFLANISHELRTPMNAIIGMTELALEEELPASARDYLRTARSSAGVLLGLLNEILDISRLEAGKFTLEPEPFRLRHVLDETLRTLAVHAYDKGLEIIGDYPADLQDGVIGDSLRVRQILMNLLGNAIKFTNEGEVSLRVRVASESDDEIEYSGAVTDSGIGIAEADHERIFAPFTQADSSTTRTYGGTGLGLAIASDLIGMMGGRIGVESRLGAGSTFAFSLRLKRNPLIGPESEPAALRAFRGQRILIAEGHETTGRTLSDAAAEWGLLPELVTDGTAALEKLKQAAAKGAPYAIVVIDRMVEVREGERLVDSIAGRRDLAGSVILMLPPAERQKASVESGKIAGLIILEKPVTQPEFLHALLTIPDPKAALESESLPPEALVRPASRPLRVLVAEDTPANQKLIVKVLEKRGHHVTVARDGQEAVNLSQTDEFDLILMDVQMPKLDGLQATAVIRARPARHPPIPIVAMTAHAMRGDRERCLAAGMDAYISKPIRVADLVSIVERQAAASYEAELAGDEAQERSSPAGLTPR